MVNSKKVPHDYVMKDNDIICSRVHRHELAVLAAKIKIIHEDDKILVIDKPPSMPVHPCGRYRYNSLIAILHKDYGYHDLRIVHRLDRQTSGVLIFARDQATAQKMSKQLVDRNLHKEYVARVSGVFPDGEVECHEKILPLSHKLGVCIIDPEGKDCETRFKREKIYKDGTSLVRCWPKTGRTHQIRLHLQYLGHPIANDTLYNSTAFGKERGKHANYGISREEIMENLNKEHNVENWFELEDAVPPEHDEDDIELLRSFEEVLDKGRHPPFDASKLVHDDQCEECQRIYMNPTPKHLCIYLHAQKYKGAEWQFETPMPWWSKYEEANDNVAESVVV